ARTDNLKLAVGPTADIHAAASEVAAGKERGIPDRSGQYAQEVDVDGDHHADLAWVGYMCAGHAVTAGTEICIETWSRVGDTKWTMLDYVEIPHCVHAST